MKLPAAHLAVLDQGAWAMRSLLFVVLVAQTTSASRFGLLMLGLATLIFMSGFAASMAGEVLSVTRGVLLRKSCGTEQASEARAVAARALGIVVVCGLVAPGVLALSLFAFGSGLELSWAEGLLLGGALPAVVAEGCRAHLYACQQMRSAAAVSNTWLLTQVVATGVLAFAVELNAVIVLTAWVIGALLAAIAGLGGLRLRPRLGGASTEEWSRRKTYAFEYLATVGPTQSMAFIAGASIDLKSAGSIRALQTLYGPLNVVLAGMANAIVPVKAQDPTGAVRSGKIVAGLGALMAVIATAALVLFPDLGTLLLGPAWPATAVVLAYGLGRCAQSAVYGATIVYRANDSGWLSWRLRLVTAMLIVGSFSIGCQISLSSAVWALAGGSLLAGVAWWWGMGRAVGSPEPPNGS